MADAEDLEAVVGGTTETDGRDLRGADLSGLDLSGRRFANTRLDKVVAKGTNFAASDFRGARMSQLDATGADLSNAVLETIALSNVVFARADLRGAKLSRSHLNSVNLKGADLRGAEFVNAQIQDGTDLTDCLVDATTRFDGARMLRPMARQRAFMHYRYEDGALVRKDEVSADSNGAESGDSGGGLSIPEARAEPDLLELFTTTDEALRTLNLLIPAADAGAEVMPPGIGHNSPPPEAGLTEADYKSVSETLQTLRAAAERGALPDNLMSGRERIQEAANKIRNWAVDCLPAIRDGALNQIGASLIAIGTWTALSGKLNLVAAAISKLLGIG